MIRFQGGNQYQLRERTNVGLVLFPGVLIDVAACCPRLRKVAPADKNEKNRHLFCAASRRVLIEGGNHFRVAFSNSSADVK